jgi:HTH-type transcriptional repressor of NAD biosynthesis genes
MPVMGTTNGVKTDMKSTEFKTGVCVGKYSPPHRGHISAIVQASTQCDQLVVVVSHHDELEKEMYAESTAKPCSMVDKARWLSKELEGIENVTVKMLDETSIPVYPYGWEPWSKLLHKLVGPIDAIFGGEPTYNEGFTKYFPETKYVLHDIKRLEVPVSATKIRGNVRKYFKYIIKAARPHFTKRILITGGESSAKTSTCIKLAKLYNTTYAREEGRFYSNKYLGGNEEVFTRDDFFQIAQEQAKTESIAAEGANWIMFVDTDAIVTQFYLELYLGESDPRIDSFVNLGAYDKILCLDPRVPWVSDGKRFISDAVERWNSYSELMSMYYLRGGSNNMRYISGNYTERLNSCISLIKQEETSK